jgi:alpha-L-arabinofuranosidase
MPDYIIKYSVYGLMVLGLYIVFHIPAASQGNIIVVNIDKELSKISRHIYGQFAEHLGRGIYEGIWVGEDSDIPNIEGYRADVLEALRQLEIPNVRWPGGCFADEYNWRDGVGPRENRPRRVNTHWGMVIEENSFGTHEFLRLMELIGAEPVIAMNVGSGTPREMAEWIEYLNYEGSSALADLRTENGREKPWGVTYVGIGNESWGCGGNMDVEFYTDLYKQYATYTKNYSGHELFRIASGFYNDQYHWTDKLMEEAAHVLQGISLHYYTIAGEGWHDKGPSIDFGEELYFSGLKAAMKLDEYVKGHALRMDKYDPEKRVALIVDEWGIWTNPLPGTNPGFLEQQNSLRDALIAATSLDILNQNSDRVRMANIAQMVNVLQAMILTQGDKMIKTPTYHVYDLYRVHYDAALLHTHLQSINHYELNDESIPTISTTVSKDKDGRINITITNTHARNREEVTMNFRGRDLRRTLSGHILTADKVSAVNTYDNPDNVSVKDFSDFNLRDNVLSITLPPKSVVRVTVE